MVSCRIVGIPTIPFTAAGNGSLPISALNSITVDSLFADSRNEHGETLIPPSLLEFADTFKGDLHHALGLNVSRSVAKDARPHSIFLTVGDVGDYIDARGAPTYEGYTLSVSASGVRISGASALGVWWGTRTLLQLALISDGHIPFGTSKDAPGWPVRGMMLDDGRHYYPPSVSLLNTF